jgi:hypothetical protein
VDGRLRAELSEGLVWAMVKISGRNVFSATAERGGL